MLYDSARQRRDLLLIAVGMRVLLDTDTPTAELQTATSRMGIDLVALVSLSLLRVNSALILRANEAQTLYVIPETLYPSLSFTCTSKCIGASV